MDGLGVKNASRFAFGKLSRHRARISSQGYEQGVRATSGGNTDSRGVLFVTIHPGKCKGVNMNTYMHRRTWLTCERRKPAGARAGRSPQSSECHQRGRRSSP